MRPALAAHAVAAPEHLRRPRALRRRGAGTVQCWRAARGHAASHACARTAQALPRASACAVGGWVGGGRGGAPPPRSPRGRRGSSARRRRAAPAAVQSPPGRASSWWRWRPPAGPSPARTTCQRRVPAPRGCRRGRCPRASWPWPRTRGGRDGPCFRRRRRISARVSARRPGRRFRTAETWPAPLLRQRGLHGIRQMRWHYLNYVNWTVLLLGSIDVLLPIEIALPPRPLHVIIENVRI